MVRSHSRTGRTLHLTRRQYRDFAQKTKAVGLGLNVSTWKRMGCWGMYSPWALLVCKDATNPDPKWDERSLITIASAINADHLRAVGPKRPELDWSVLEDDEVYPFLVHHEIGHRVDNFDNWGIMDIKDLVVRDDCHRRITFVNEMLADRYAWNAIRPGEPIPLSENGARLQEKAAASLALLEKHAPKMNKFRINPLDPDPYRDVPDYMLASPDRAAFLGPRVSSELVAARSAYHRQRVAEGGRPVY